VGRRHRLMTMLAAVAAVVLLASCGGGDGGGGGADDASATARGPITYVQGKDNSNVVRPLLEKWNAAHPNEKITFKEQSDEADQQHDDLVQHFQAKDPEYDVVSVDVIWTAEFAAKGWLHPLKDSFALDTAPLLPATVATATYNKTLYNAPVTSDGGMLYYRKDLVSNPPKTWDEMMGMCSIAKENNMDCYAGQFQKYEGLTVNAAEAINGAGGVITDDEGKPNVNTPEAKEGLDFLVNGFKQGYIPKEAITYKEEEGRRAFQAGKLIFHRQWPYQYQLASKTDGSSKVAGKFAVAPLPGKDGPGVSSLGGHNVAISAYSTKKKTAIEFIKFYTNLENNKDQLIKASLAPIYTSLYDDAALTKQFPYIPVLKASIESAKPRPKVVRYGDATTAIQDAAYAALRGEKSSDQALSELQTKLEGLTQ
jgi:trehalose/maltose transport system substrate-binding protein